MLWGIVLSIEKLGLPIILSRDGEVGVLVVVHSLGIWGICGGSGCTAFVAKLIKSWHPRIKGVEVVGQERITSPIALCIMLEAVLRFEHVVMCSGGDDIVDAHGCVVVCAVGVSTVCSSSCAFLCDRSG